MIKKKGIIIANSTIAWPRLSRKYFMKNPPLRMGKEETVPCPSLRLFLPIKNNLLVEFLNCF
jgi:hypothetical protein